MDDLLAEFVAEARDMLEALAGEMVEWEADPTARDRLDSIFRFFHTVKGNCGFFDFPRLEALSHAAEDALCDVRSGARVPDAALVDAVLAVIDRITAMVEAIDSGADFPEGDDESLIEALKGASESPEQDFPAQPAQADMQPAKPASSVERTAAGARSIRLSVDLLDRIMSGISDMALARNDLLRRIDAGGNDDALRQPLTRLSTLLDDVREAITHTRMQRIETLFAAFPRMVRDLSAELGRQVMVELESGDVELDREMIELIRDPLLHVVRNAIDHGIEPPADRLAAGKREIGLLTIWARQSGNEIRIGINDDGRGIDTTRLVDKAIAAGLITAEQVETMSEDARTMLVCEPGLSTSDQISAISGRGVGMDVVRANLERIGGSLEIRSTRGAGTRMVMRVPLTLSIVPSLTVAVGAARFAIPRSYVDEVVRVDATDKGRARVGGQQLVIIRDRRIPCMPLRQILALGDAGGPMPEIMIVIRLAGGNKIAFAVDSILDHAELVIKPLPPLVMDCGYYSGASQLDDGSMVLMLDVVGVARDAGVLDDVERVDAHRVESASAANDINAIPALQFVGLDGRRRAMPMGAVLRVQSVDESAIRAAGGAAQVAIDDHVIPLVGLADGQVPQSEIQIFRMSDGTGGELAYAIARIDDITRIEGALSPAGGETRHVAGLALINGEPVEVVDCHALFADHLSKKTLAVAPSCRLPGNDRWCQDFLRPLVESAGYRIAGQDEAEKVDLAIALHGQDAASPCGAARALVLRDTSDAGDGMADTIWRYDRDGLLAALDAVRKARAA